jgi:DNA-binding GntR family transcriptional regulator
MSPTLSEQIANKLQVAVSRGKEPPCRLTLTAIAEQYGVSIQPVRTAVDCLLNEGWLLRNSQGRLAMNPKKRGQATEFSAAPVEPLDISEKLEEIIIQHSLRGEAVFLREGETAKRLGVGRAVLRSVLTRMHGRGLVEHVPRRGWRVVGYDESRMLEYLDVRETLELRALDLAKGRLEDAVIEDLLVRNTPDSQGNTRIDDDLHAHWIAKSANRFITAFFAQHGAYHTALFNYASLAAPTLRAMAVQHHAILKALLERKHADARNHLREHIRSQRPNVARLTEQLADKSASDQFIENH